MTASHHYLDSFHILKRFYRKRLRILQRLDTLLIQQYGETPYSPGIFLDILIQSFLWTSNHCVISTNEPILNENKK